MSCMATGFRVHTVSTCSMPAAPVVSEVPVSCKGNGHSIYIDSRGCQCIDFLLFNSFFLFLKLVLTPHKWDPNKQNVLVWVSVCLIQGQPESSMEKKEFTSSDSSTSRSNTEESQGWKSGAWSQTQAEAQEGWC